jgi:hypothetical protein
MITVHHRMGRRDQRKHGIFVLSFRGIPVDRNFFSNFFRADLTLEFLAKHVAGIGGVAPQPDAVFCQLGGRGL